MKSTLGFIPSLALLLAAAQSVIAGKAENFFARAKILEKRATGSREPFKHPVLQERATDLFLNNKTNPFAVNGTGIPEVPFDIGESYAGLLPISSSPDETRQIFFWFFPTTNPVKTDEIIIWMNGGTGCSSVGGLLKENGPFTWQPGTLAPIQNPYTWVNLTNVVWVEYPIGSGLNLGTPNITNEYQLAQQFTGFYKNFVDLFGLHKWKTYFTGESYAGFYVPYIADAFIQANDTDYYNLGGISINDPIIGDTTVQAQVTVKPFVDYWSNVFYLNNTFTKYLGQLHNDCGYQTYLDKYFRFPPPKEQFPVLPDSQSVTGNSTCDVIGITMDAIAEINPCFNMYHITDTCPYTYSVLKTFNDGYSPPEAQYYWSRTDVLEAIHAPLNSTCDADILFVDNEDNSLGPAQNGVLQRVIEHTGNVIIGSGRLDFLLSTNGTILALQNVTWNGKQGFQQYPSQNDFFVPYHPEYTGGSLAGAGKQGTWGSERGLTFYEIQLSGHKLPENTPGAGYRALELLTGRIKDLSQPSDFTTQEGDFGNSLLSNKKDFYLNRFAVL
ncbi:putative serine carboxypeptidase [Lachnellula occidentalis]|uniref:Putative serine carboxypeptidase n=1 Tax=Lachnellula occidentalis TaxID=215460 RepID=A0A8H8RTG9_9HELO|nr:putative serine carboxypeptidase [Lachnellula occidentalis]